MATSRRSKGFALMLTVSLFVAAAAFAGTPLVNDYYSLWEAETFDSLFLIGLLAFWGILMLVALIRYRLRGLWFLIGAPVCGGNSEPANRWAPC
jgi:hypothetical protein